MRIPGNQLLNEIHGPYQFPLAAEPGRRHLAQSAGRLIAGFAAWCRAAGRRRMLRRAEADMARLDDRMLADIGITRIQIGAAVAGVPLRECVELADRTGA
ncbi:DUF1127 domain-containing protein [Bosea sp. (in: a-proteobacteria)]|uniref:DUF1127 domain-containing protein n=1 Tax=Bosea sp. (in: a-proteobacteria) TaxID=1871050 RepID=UPI002FC8E1A2